MSQAIIYQTDDGVAVIHPAPGKSADDCIKDVPEGVPFKVVPVSATPSDRYFRAAWEFDSAGVKINVEKAKEIQRGKWRRLRVTKLAELDIAFMQALEDASPSRRNAIKDKKQALRDVTGTPLPDDLEEIRKIIPTILTEP